MKSKIKNIIKKWDYLACLLKVIVIKFDSFISKFYTDEEYIENQYKRRTGKILDLNNPKTFNEKIQWMKLNYHNEIMHKCVDKYDVREIVKENIGKEILIKNYGVWDNFDDIDFDKLPNDFILKLTNGSSFNYICKNKSKKEIRKMRRRFKMWLKIDYYRYGKEWAYKGVKNRIICEELLKPSSGNPPEDYRFFCFNGKVYCFSIDYDSVINGIKNSNYKRNIYDRNGCKLDARIEYPNKEDINQEKNEYIDKMIEYAEILSKDFPHARIDFYNFDGKIYFGEITFYHSSGYQKFRPENFELELGNQIKINDSKKIGVIGHFGGNNFFCDGQTVKTKEVNNYFEKYYGIETMKFDTYKNARNPFRLFNGVRKLFKSCPNIILIVSTRGYKVLLPLLMFFNRKYKRKILDFVIGGNRYEIYKNKFLQKLAKKTDRIYVETDKIKEGYEKYRFGNVYTLPNFKNLQIKKIDQYKTKNEFRLCTFSRVCKEKGIGDAIELVNRCNKKYGKNIFYLDIYGPIEQKYNEEFQKLLKSNSKTIFYRGMVDFDRSTEIISNYDLLLFLTFWYGEGFPGTIIDSLFSGVPVMATDFRYNFNILSDGITGIKVNVNDLETMEEKLMYYFNNQDKIYNMKKNCITEAKKYLPDNVMEKVIEYIG